MLLEQHHRYMAAPAQCSVLPALMVWDLRPLIRQAMSVKQCAETIFCKDRDDSLLLGENLTTNRTNAVVRRKRSSRSRQIRQNKLSTAILL